MTASTQTVLASDVDVIRRILTHIDDHTTDEGEAWREPVEHYVDQRRFDRELAALRSSPSVFAPSAAIPSSGDHVDRDVFGVPLFAVRDRAGEVHVFRNACRHRGAAVVTGAGCSRSLVCPYHGWTYGLDGSLAQVPHAGGFPDLDAASRGLVEVVCDEVDGLIVIDAVDPSPTRTLADRRAAMSAQTAGRAWHGVLAPDARLAGMSSMVIDVNWKVLVEQFLEGYHIRTTHRQTFFPLQYDNLNVVETFGASSRVTYPYRSIERLRDRDETAWTVGGTLTFVYQLFPNVMLATFPDRLLVIAVEPLDVGRSTMTISAVIDPARSPRSGAEFAAAADGSATVPSLVDRGGSEDNAMSLAVQRGLRAGANAFVEFGRHESAIGHFHRSLEALLEQAAVPASPVEVRPGTGGSSAT